MNTRIENKMFNDRIILLSGKIEDGMANDIVMQLLYLYNKSPEEDIYLYINSGGGSVSSGMAIYDTMKHIKCDVCTICIGLAASMAAFLLSSGTPGKRYSLPHSTVMLHQPHIGCVTGQISDVQIAARQSQRLKDSMIRIISHNTGKPYEQIEADLDRDKFLTAQEALEYGVIDEIL